MSHSLAESEIMGLSDGVHFTILLSLSTRHNTGCDRRTGCCRKNRALPSVARIKSVQKGKKFMKTDNFICNQAHVLVG